MSWLLDHAVNPKLAQACGVDGEPGGAITFTYGHSFIRTRLADGKMIQPKGQPLSLYWPAGKQNVQSVILCEGEGDTLAAASVLCDDVAEPRPDLPPPLAGLCPVGAPGSNTPTRVILGELLASGCRECFIAFDADDAGKSAAERLADALPAVGIEPIVVELPEGCDLADCLAGFSEGVGSSPVDHPGNAEITGQGRSVTGPLAESTSYLAHLLADAQAVAA